MADAAEIKDIADADLDWVHPLNQRHAEELSPLDRAEMARMVTEAAYARLIIPDCAFLLAFDQGAAYDSPNFLWFCEHFDRFLYIDRVAVAAHARRRGLAATLYRDVFAFAATAGYAAVVAEINSHPPNPGSDAFHDAQGFRTVGQADLPGRGKSVRYVAKDLADHAAGAPANP